MLYLLQQRLQLAEVWRNTRARQKLNSGSSSSQFTTEKTISKNVLCLLLRIIIVHVQAKANKICLSFTPDCLAMAQLMNHLRLIFQQKLLLKIQHCVVFWQMALRKISTCGSFQALLLAMQQR
jgi:hypothetical protein